MCMQSLPGSLYPLPNCESLGMRLDLLQQWCGTDEGGTQQRKFEVELVLCSTVTTLWSGGGQR